MEKRLLKDVDPKTLRCGVNFRDEEHIAELVEEPLVDACRTLFRKNIQTVSSSANSTNAGGTAYISLNAGSLSEKNKEIALTNGALQKTENLIFEMPISADTRVEDISSFFNKIAETFETQEFNWAEKLSFVDFVRMFNPGASAKEIDAARKNGYVETNTIDGGKCKVSWKDFIKTRVDSGGYYDEDTEYLYFSEMEYRKEKLHGKVLSTLTEPELDTDIAGKLNFLKALREGIAKMTREEKNKLYSIAWEVFDEEVLERTRKRSINASMKMAFSRKKNPDLFKEKRDLLINTLIGETINYSRWETEEYENFLLEKRNKDERVAKWNDKHLLKELVMLRFLNMGNNKNAVDLVTPTYLKHCMRKVIKINPILKTLF